MVIETEDSWGVVICINSFVVATRYDMVIYICMTFKESFCAFITCQTRYSDVPSVLFSFCDMEFSCSATSKSSSGSRAETRKLQTHLVSGSPEELSSIMFFQQDVIL